MNPTAMKDLNKQMREQDLLWRYEVPRGDSALVYQIGAAPPYHDDSLIVAMYPGEDETVEVYAFPKEGTEGDKIGVGSQFIIYPDGRVERWVVKGERLIEMIREAMESAAAPEPPEPPEKVPAANGVGVQATT